MAKLDMTLFAAALLAAALGGCGSASSSDPPPPPSSPARASARHEASRVERAVAVAKATYRNEVAGGKLLEQVDRIAHDGVLLAALRRGDLAGAQAEANSQLTRPLNHFVHVTRIAVVRGSREVVNATVNANGVFVVAPGQRVLRVQGHTLGTLWVSIQDVVGYAKLVHNLTLAAVVVRGASGQVRTSPGAGAAANTHLPRSGRATIVGRTYLVRSFGETGWGGEALTTWVLEPA